MRGKEDFARAYRANQIEGGGLMKNYEHNLITRVVPLSSLNVTLNLNEVRERRG